MNDNDAIIARIKGVPATRATAESDRDPRNPNLPPQFAPTEAKRCKHPKASEVDGSQRDGWPGGDIVTMECPDCGAQWEAKLPQ